ncbi:MAG: 50S ribosomal protein L5 [bacterium]|nr:50S ribosomal protein L5 [bacterium]
MTRIQTIYMKTAVPELMKKFGLRNKMEAPKVEKVVLNIGFGKLISGKAGDEEKKVKEEVLRDLSLITGQRPSLTLSRKAIAGFKLREGVPIGAKVTLRGPRMYDFLERLVNVVLPRSRDFRGIPLKTFDQKGNLNIGVREMIFFPEILPEKVRVPLSLEITVHTGAKTREQGIELLRLIGFPLE